MNSLPCVRPGKKYLVLQKGQASTPTQWQLLALQGIQKQEVEAFDLQEMPTNLVGDLAGNMFTANVLSAFLLAYLSEGS